MLPSNFLTAERIRCDVQISSKKRALEEIGNLLACAAPDLTEGSVFDHLLERERLGSTGLGHGVALPHARIKNLTQACGAFIRLETGIDYDAADGKPVDLIFGLLVPQEATREHLQLLGTLATLFGDAEFRERLRGAGEAEGLLRLIRDHKQYPKSA